MGKIVLPRSPLEGKEHSKLWRFPIGGKQKVIAVAEASWEDIFLLLAGYTNCDKWVACENSLIIAS